jgi:ubiquitin-conjugating enzyme E2 Z
MSAVTISKESVHRLLSDVREIMKNPLHSNGIYYSHDDTDMLSGWAMIVGPEDTPYFGGFYFFKFQFPTDYPYSPPIVTCHTKGGRIRFNPNLYTSGKVCISILNTWRGEPWSSCQTISTVLLTLCTVFCKNPILNEPGLRLDNPDSKPYNEILEYANIKISICEVVNNLRVNGLQFVTQFADSIEQRVEQNYAFLLAFLESKKHIEPYLCTTRIYGLREMIDYPALYDIFLKIKLK